MSVVSEIVEIVFSSTSPATLNAANVATGVAAQGLDERILICFDDLRKLAARALANGISHRPRTRGGKVLVAHIIQLRPTVWTHTRDISKNHQIDEFSTKMKDLSKYIMLVEPFGIDAEIRKGKIPRKL